ncbi:phosphate ABC transporter permease PstA [Plebeiibacterium sediminum]|uniref:Phosphate transport system permease protein PstA n=1 Tax=Plebeiibacterium sediminum TaxID=2992112 RepID=A0AAE3SHW3_9BACT|nr:phosphate ABC transporter permease PstA [Plebeiobacterium sediminum]MCW3788538.1 phosphate ABC transporter permease PstA [Plebeiobacterium sediminum]
MENINTPIELTKNSAFRALKDKAFLWGVIIVSIITISPIVLIIGKLVWKGVSQINLSFFTEITPSTFEAMTAVASGEVIPGGIVNGILGTFLIVFLSAIIAIPVGILIGLFLFENQGKRYANLIRSLSDILQGVPSIVLGLIAYLWVVKNVTQGYSALAGSVALAIMMLPLIIRSTEETMKMIPGTLKEAGLALGVPYYKVILKVLIPSGISGLSTGILLAISRILGETAPLMLTTLGNPMINWDVTAPTSAVPLLIWDFYNDPNMVDLIWSSSLFLMGFVLTLNIISKRIAAKQ